MLLYNEAAAGVVAMQKKVSQCDAHGAVEAHCGAGYASCDIAQCQGPHFTEQGFNLLAETVATCVMQGP